MTRPLFRPTSGLNGRTRCPFPIPRGDRSAQPTSAGATRLGLLLNGLAVLVLTATAMPAAAGETPHLEKATEAETGQTSAPPAAVAAEAEPERYLLRYQFQSGAVLRWDVLHRSRVRTSVSGSTQTAESTSQSIKAWQVREVDEDGTVTFVHLVESVDMRHTIDDANEVRYNSKSDPVPPPGYENLARSLNVPLAFVKMDARGQIVEKSAQPAEASVVGDGLMTLLLPQDPVAVGDTWTLPQEVIVPLETGVSRRVQLMQRCTLENVRTGIATIRVANQILTPIHDPALEAKLVQRQTEGRVRFDIDSGRVVSQQMDLDRRVIGFRGETSSLHYVIRFNERFLPDRSGTATEAAASAAEASLARTSR